MENKWIPVSERLPETKGFYLVVVDESVASKLRGRVEIGELYETVNLATMKPILNFQVYVTHWMPLPDLP